MKFNRKTASPGLCCLGIMYNRVSDSEVKDLIREAANRGFEHLRFFNCCSDQMNFKDYNGSYFSHLRKRLSYFFHGDIQMMTPIISISGYYRQNANRLTHKEWESVITKTISLMTELFGSNYMVEIANEPTKAPNTFVLKNQKGKYLPTKYPKDSYIYEVGEDFKSGMPAEMQRLGMWHRRIYEVLLKNGITKNQMMLNVHDRPTRDEEETRGEDYYPKLSSSADMVMGGEKWGVASIDGVEVKDLIVSFHRIMCEDDTKSRYGAGRMHRGRRCWKYHLTTDGNSATLTAGKGADPSPEQDGNFKTIDGGQLYRLSRYVFSLAKTGLGSVKFPHNISIMLSDMPRDQFSWTITYKCESCGHIVEVANLTPGVPRPLACPKCKGKIKAIKYKLCTDWSLVDFERLENMVVAYKEVFGEFPPNRGKFPKEDIPAPEIPEPLEPEPSEKKSEEENRMKTPWSHLLPKWKWRKPFLVVDFKGFWQNSTIFQKFVAISGLEIAHILLILLVF